MTDIVDDLRDLNSMHTPKEVSDIGEKAADEIERLQLREETLSGIIDGMTARFIEAQGAVEEIERLRQKHKDMVSKEIVKLKQQNAELVEELWGIALESGSREASEMARAAIAKATGGE